ncbi:hypothetical protein [Sorangium sp. So ce1024]|uniref:hypothetical protein n=1 Tax=Sorangium sp. So ce1024 TaxID=3133327 RepID=UPI003F0E03FD
MPTACNQTLPPAVSPTAHGASAPDQVSIHGEAATLLKLTKKTVTAMVGAEESRVGESRALGLRGREASSGQSSVMARRATGATPAGTR